jgi:hypothetical protein
MTKEERASMEAEHQTRSRVGLKRDNFCSLLYEASHKLLA